MGLFGKSQEEKLAEIRALIREATHDGIVTQEEVNLVMEKAKKYKVVGETTNMLDRAIKVMEEQNIHKIERLIMSAFSKGTISEDKRNTIYEKAAKFNIRPGECDILIEKMSHENKRNNSFRKIGIIAGSVLVVILGIYLTFAIILSPSNKEKHYSSIDEAIANYDFVAARALLAEVSSWDKQQEMVKIIQSEVTYYSSNKTYDKAISSLNEYNFEDSFSETNSFYYPDDGKEQISYDNEVEWYNNTLYIIISQLILEKSEVNAILYLNTYAKPKAKYSYTKDKLHYFTKDFSWRDEKIKEIKKMK